MTPSPPPPDQGEPSPEQRRQAARATIILYVAMPLLGALPLIALWWSNRSR